MKHSLFDFIEKPQGEVSPRQGKYSQARTNLDQALKALAKKKVAY